MVKICHDPKEKGKMIEDRLSVRSNGSRDMIKGKGKMIKAAPAKALDDEETDMTRLTLAYNPPPPQLSQSPPLSLSPQYLLGGFFPDIPELPPWTSYVNQHNYQAQLLASASASACAAAAAAAPFAAGGSTGGSSSSSSIQNHREAPPRGRRSGGGANPRVMLRPGKAEIITPVYPWATTRRATVHRYDYLVENGIINIRGTVQCNRCEQQYEMAYDVSAEFPKIWRYVAENKLEMVDRAPEAWKTPVLPTCRLCEQENSARPVIGDKKRKINWLFLLLGQLLGCCTLDQLKYFCKHSRNHRTGAKDRVLYLTYLGLCRMLDPDGPFDPLER